KEGFTANELPWKFEAGTPPIAEAVGLGAAVDYLEGLGMEAVRAHEVSLTAYALRSPTERFGDDLVIPGPSEPADRGGALAFAYRAVHPPGPTPGCDQPGRPARARHHAARAVRRRPRQPRALGAGRPWRRAVVRLPRRPPPRPHAGLRPARRLRPGWPPLRQAAHARAGRRRHRPRLAVRLQRRVRRRR